MNNRPRRRRRKPVNPAIAIYWILFVLVLIYAAGLPLLQFWLQSNQDSASAIRDAGLTLGETIQQRLMTVFFLAWIFFFGAALGSFLNVVVFRMPRGESIVSRGSRCPYCETDIEARDNIPVFGWIGLRGRCRACRLPISMRYPIVEFICGVMFLWLAGFELLSGGANLPDPQPFRRPGLAFVVMAPDWTLIASTLVHGWLCCMLMVWSLWEIDNARTPWKFVLFGWLLALAACIGFERFHPVPWIAVRPDWLPTVAAPWNRLESPLIGLMVGALCGFLLADRKRIQSFDGAAMIAAGATIGVMLGWQSACSIATLAAIGLASRKCLGVWRPLRFPILLGAVLIHIAFWKALDQSPWWPGQATAVWAWIPIAGVVALQWFVILDEGTSPTITDEMDRVTD